MRPKVKVKRNKNVKYYRVDLTKHDDYCYVMATSKKEANDKALDENMDYDFAYPVQVSRKEYKEYMEEGNNE